MKIDTSLSNILNKTVLVLPCNFYIGIDTSTSNMVTVKGIVTMYPLREAAL